MDTLDTTSPSTDLDLATARAIELDSTLSKTPGFGTEVSKTLAVSTATSAVLFGGYFVTKMLVPKVRRWVKSRKKAVPATIEDAKEAVNKAATKVKNQTEKD